MTGATGGNGYFAKAPIQVTFKPVFETGVELTAKNGCGTLCGYYKSPDQLKNYDLTFELCDLDHELIELLTGEAVIKSGANSIGHEFSRVSSCSPLTPNGVAVEFWSKRWLQCANPAAGTAQYFHWLFPRAYLHTGQIVMKNDFMTVPIEGFLQENPNWGRGPWTGNLYPNTGGIAALGAVWEDTVAPPTAANGYITVPGGAAA